MSLYQIESNVPLVHIRKPKREIYPFSKLKVGDSFFVPAKDTRTIPRVRVAACTWAKENNRKLASRAVDGGVRIWRVK
jgi:hypothetical protein